MINFEKWSMSSGRWCIRHRIYRKGDIWTPFCTVRLRYRRGTKWTLAPPEPAPIPEKKDSL